jgi:cytochrome c peroxidase
MQPLFRFTYIVASAAIVVATFAVVGRQPAGARWSVEERTTLASLSLDKLEPLAADPSNRVADDANAARLGRQLFFDVKLSANGKVSCAERVDPPEGVSKLVALMRGDAMARIRQPGKKDGDKK